MVARADMAPPESAVEGFGYGDPKRDIDRSNYVRKTDEYVRRAEAYKLQPRVPDFEKLRCGFGYDTGCTGKPSVFSTKR